MQLSLIFKISPVHSTSVSFATAKKGSRGDVSSASKDGDSNAIPSLQLYEFFDALIRVADRVFRIEEKHLAGRLRELFRSCRSLFKAGDKSEQIQALFILFVPDH